MSKFDKNELETLKYLEDIVETYEEIASIRMQKVKQSVLSNRSFLDGLRDLAGKVKYSYEKELDKLQKVAKDEQLRRNNGRTIAVLLTANTGLYGDIVAKNFKVFKDYLMHATDNVDVAVVGKVGARMYQGLNLERSVEFFELSDSFSDKDNVSRLLKYLLEYKDIIVFHGLYESMLEQKPIAINLSGEKNIWEDSDDAESSQEKNKSIEKGGYIFEPSLEDVVSFFEKEILSATFKHALHESSLSKYASRMISLDRATEKIHGRIDETTLNYQRTKHRRQNRKQLSTLATIFSS